MKKIIALLLAAVMVLGLAACAGKPADTTPSGDTKPADTKTTDSTTKATEPAAAATGSVYYLNFKPEADQAWQDLAKLYTEKTGVKVTVVTAASGTYNDTLTAEMDKSAAPTMFQVGNQGAVESWGDYCLDLRDTDVYKEMTTDSFNLYNDAGEAVSIGYCYEAFGIIVNKALLKQAGYELSDITNFETLKKVADDIHARAGELGFDAFTSAGLDGSSSWRFSGHLANMPLYYQFRDNNVTKKPATITNAYLENYKFHNPSLSDLKTITGPGGALEALQEAKAAGKIGHIGLTAHSTAVFAKALEMDWVETVMFPYNIVESQGEDLIRQCGEQNVGFICMKPLAGGAIENATLALRYILTNPDVTVAIPGMAAEGELAQNLAAAGDASPLSDGEKAEMQAIRDSLGTQFCRRCNYCAPCSVGISIPSVFLMDGYLSRYGLADWARERYNAMAMKAGDCIGCGECEKRCPYHLPIREMMQKAKAHFGA